MSPRRPLLSPLGVACRELAEPGLEDALFQALVRGAARFDLGPEHVALARELVGWQPGLGEEERAALLLVALALLVGQGRGSTRVPVLGAEGGAWLSEVARELLPAPEPGEPAPPGLALPAAASLVATAQALLRQPARLDQVLGSPGARRPLVLGGDWLSAARHEAEEAALGSALRARLAATPAPALDPARVEAGLARLRAHPARSGGRELVLTAAQEEAVRRVAAGALTVITGGPGAGKTSVVVALLRLLCGLGLAPGEVALAAPTGRAAQRLGEALAGGLAGLAAPTTEEAALLRAAPVGVTLHRLLGWSPGRSEFLAGPGAPLPQALVVVDEASMIDLRLMARLAGAVRPEARLVLLGDADQLPAVGAGAVLRELADEDGPPALRARTVRLGASLRVDPGDPGGAAILECAARVRAAEPAPGAPPPDWLLALPARLEPGELRGAGVELLPAPTGLEAFLLAWEARHLAPLAPLAARTWRWGPGFEPGELEALRALFRAHEASRLLCFTRVGRTGTRAVNALLHRQGLRARGLSPRASEALLAGEPLLVVQNDHERGLWNGERGLALWVQREEGATPQLQAVFRRGEGFEPHPLPLLQDRLERAWALTVHKAQGAEHDQVAVLLPERDGPALSREVLYTAITRARRSVVLVGAPELLARALARRGRRWGGLGARLADAGEGP